MVYNDLTGNFPFMSLDGSVCFFVLHHYETNAILATPIASLDDKSIFEVYKTQFEMLEEKGCKPKVNVTDNQATNYIKQFLTKKECKLQLVEPHNQCVNAAERAIQTFKDAFIATKPRQYADHGHREVPTLGYWAHQRTITGVISITYPRCGRTESLALRSSSRNIANYRICRHTNTLKHSHWN